jgi:hypothetical protein
MSLSSSSSSSKQQTTPTTKREILSMLHKVNSMTIPERELLKTQQKEKQLQNDHSYTQKRLVQQMDSNDDFLSMTLVNASFRKLLFITRIVLQLINRQCDALSYNETIFSDYTPIYIVEETETVVMSFRMYYNMIYDEALQTRYTVIAANKEYHLKKLLKACFIIAFVYDIRITRFVMARHMVHYKDLLSKPPNLERATSFIEEIRLSFVDPFLSNDPSTDIIQMVTNATNTWIDKYMSNIKPQQQQQQQQQ